MPRAALSRSFHAPPVEKLKSMGQRLRVLGKALRNPKSSAVPRRGTRSTSSFPLRGLFSRLNLVTYREGGSSIGWPRNDQESAAPASGAGLRRASCAPLRAAISTRYPLDIASRPPFVFDSSRSPFRTQKSKRTSSLTLTSPFAFLSPRRCRLLSKKHS